ncbi:methyltransferase domain-containing protein [Bacillus sp. BRMEA1]|uniref:class I SAM-dependent methyltransferase n=1 Tax=Neobacillus endophyticus TaxID=2738405 RepID=UPI0015644349|nr:class I SAM-dependent methyltransferase [Neobacillus endophyticus]NRD80238.1 methyltransferase domain-containing protein [Neobacillus endophyticus]
MDHKSDVQKQFGKSASSYINSTHHKEGKDLKKLLEMAELKSEDVLLDVATGGGHTANTFAPFVKKVMAIDLTDEMLVEAEKFVKGNGHANIEFIKGDAENLPFDKEIFDIATCRIAPHHFPSVNKFISEVHRVLKPNGQFLIDDNIAPEDDELDQFYNKVEKWRDFSHFRAWKKTEWIRMLEFHGFSIEEFHRFEKTFHFESWCARMNLPTSEKNNLSQFLFNSSLKIKNKFKIVFKDEQVISFKGEALMLKAVKQ